MCKTFNLDGSRILYSLHFLRQITKEEFHLEELDHQLVEVLTQVVTFPPALEAISLQPMEQDHQQEVPTLLTLEETFLQIVEVTSHHLMEEPGLQQEEHILPTLEVIFPQHKEVTFHLAMAGHRNST